MMRDYKLLHLYFNVIVSFFECMNEKWSFTQNLSMASSFLTSAWTLLNTVK